MRTINKIIFVCVTLTCFGSCLPEPLDIKNVPVLKPVLVLSSQVIPNQSIAVLVTQSFGALDAGSSTNPDSLLQSIIVGDAMVTITHNDVTDTLLYIANGVYGSATIPLIDDDTYFLTVVAPALATATSSTTMKQLVAFDTVNTSLTVSGRDTLLDVHYKLTDPVGKKNWYMIDIQRYRARRSITDNLNPRVFIKAFTDEDFEGQVHEEEFTVPFRRFSKGDTVAIELANISEDYYTYLKETADQRNNLSALVSDPLTLPTNVKNGYGYFNMQIPDVHVFKLQ